MNGGVSEVGREGEIDGGGRREGAKYRPGEGSGYYKISETTIPRNKSLTLV